MIYLKTNTTMALKDYHINEHAPQGWEWINHSYCWAERVLGDDKFAIVALENKNIENTRKCWMEGFTLNDAHYSFWCAGAGMTRQKMGLWMRDDVWEKHGEQLNFGLTLERINTKHNGNYTCSGSRWTNYQALTLTSGTEHPFDIDRAICIRDTEWINEFEAIHVNAETGYCDTEVTRYEDKFDIDDGSACCLPGTFSEPSHGFRLGAWWKGLMTEFDWLSYDKMPETLVDCWGIEHNLREENINVIFTDSCFKTWKCWPDWDTFKEDYRRYDGQYMIGVVPCNHNERAHIAYEALQTIPLELFPKDEIERLVSPAIKEIYEIMTDARTAARATGVNCFGHYELMNSPYYLNKAREEIQNRIDKVSIGKIATDAEFYFVSPDWCAVFGGRENAAVPVGYFAITNDWQDEKIDLIRYPHMSASGHCVRRTMRHPLLTSKGCVYISALSADSKILECDYDSDKLLVFRESSPITQAAKRINSPMTHYDQGGSGEKHAVVYDFSEFGIFHEIERSYGPEANVGLWSNYTTNILNSNWPQEKKDRYCRILSAKIQNCIDTVKSGEICEVEPSILKEIKKLKHPSFMKIAKRTELEAINKERKEAAKRQGIKYTPQTISCVPHPNGSTVMGVIELMARHINFDANTFTFIEVGKIKVAENDKETSAKIGKMSNILNGRYKPVESKLKCNTFNMWTPTEECKERASAILEENGITAEQLIRNALTTKRGTGIAALITAKRDEFVEWLESNNYEVCGKTTQNQKGVRVITEDNDVFIFDSQTECAKAFEMKQPNIAKYVGDGKFHKVKMIDEKCMFEEG